MIKCTNRCKVVHGKEVQVGSVAQTTNLVVVVSSAIKDEVILLIESYRSLVANDHMQV